MTRSLIKYFYYFYIFPMTYFLMNMCLNNPLKLFIKFFIYFRIISSSSYSPKFKFIQHNSHTKHYNSSFLLPFSLKCPPFISYISLYPFLSTIFKIIAYLSKYIKIHYILHISVIIITSKGKRDLTLFSETPLTFLYYLFLLLQAKLFQKSLNS